MKKVKLMAREDSKMKPWTIEGSAGRYSVSVKRATLKIARESQSPVAERAKNARNIAKSGRELAMEYFGSKVS